ncbi:MAG: hypothetical protein WDW38_010642 [Sanguina aurantia]
MLGLLQSGLASAGVSAYFNGHDHDLQLIKAADDPVYYVVSGAGSDIREGEFTHLPDDLLTDHDFFADDQGFVAAAISGDTLTLSFYTSRLEGPAHTINIPRRA